MKKLKPTIVELVSKKTNRFAKIPSKDLPIDLEEIKRFQEAVHKRYPTEPLYH
jgi:hypothetical protein